MIPQSKFASLSRRESESRYRQYASLCRFEKMRATRTWLSSLTSPSSPSIKRWLWFRRQPTAPHVTHTSPAPTLSMYHVIRLYSRRVLRLGYTWRHCVMSDLCRCNRDDAAASMWCRRAADRLASSSSSSSFSACNSPPPPASRIIVVLRWSSINIRDVLWTRRCVDIDVESPVGLRVRNGRLL